MILQVLKMLVGIAAVLWGADRFTDGAASVAARRHMPQIVIGLTVVAFGTSMPELFVSLASAVKGAAGMAIGNVVGSNVFNTLLIVGLTAMMAPMPIARQTARIDMLWAVAAALLLVLLCADGRLQRFDGLVLLAAFAGFMAYTLHEARSGGADTPPTRPPMSYARAALAIVVGLAALVAGSNLFVGGATSVARALGVSDAVVGLTLVAGGTSLPELATSLVAARKGQSGIAIGNIIGSNVFNVLMILGLTATVCPLSLGGIGGLDLSVLVVSAVLLLVFARTDLTVKRWEGLVLALLYAAYLAVLVLQADGSLTLPAFMAPRQV